MSAPRDADTILAALRRLGDGDSEKISFSEMVTRLDARAHALVLFLLAAPNLTPGPSVPGFSSLFGLPLCVVAFEMMLGRRALRLPAILGRREIRRVRVMAITAKLAPLLLRMERILRPRLPALCSGAAERWLGAACVVIGIILSLPIPVFSMLPAAAVMAIALGLLMRDGLAVAAGLALGLGSAVVLAVLAYAVFHVAAAG